MANSRTITIRFDGSAKGLISSAAKVSEAINGVGGRTNGLKKAEAEADKMSAKLDQVAKESKEKGSVLGAGLAFGLSAAAPLVGAALIGGVSLGFVGVAALVQKNNKQVQKSFGDLKFQVVSEMKGATDQVVPYLVKSGRSLQQEFANLGPQLRTAFSFAGPDIDILTSGVDNLADNAMPGLVNTMRNSKPVVQGVAAVLGDMGTVATTVLNSVSSHSQEFGTDLAQVGTLVQHLGSITASVLPGLASGFGTTVGTANQLLGVLEPVAPLLGEITGEALPAVGAFKLFGLATAPLNKLGSKVSGIASNLGGFTTKLGGSEKAATKVVTATAKLGGALGKVGNSLPFVAAGLALADAGAQKLFGSTDQLANNLLNQTGPALQETELQLGKNDAATSVLHRSLGGVGDFLASTFVPTTKDVESGLTSVQKAQINYNEQVARFGANSKQAAAAQRNLAAANDAGQQAQQKLSFALLDTNAQLQQQQSILLGSVNANLGYQSAVLAVQQAQLSYASAVKNSGKNSLDARQAFVSLQQAQADETGAAEQAAAANNTNASASQKAKAGTQAYTSSVLNMVAAANGHFTPALAKMVGGLSAAELQSYKSTGAIKGTHQEIVGLPNGKKITLSIDNRTGKPINDVQQALRRLKGPQLVITGRDDVTGVVSAIVRRNNGRVIHVNIDASGAQINLGAGQRARGGPVQARMPYLVGEKAAEIFVPEQSGTIINGSDTARIMAGSHTTGADPVVGGDLYLTLDLGAGIEQRLRISNRQLRQAVRSGASSR